MGNSFVDYFAEMSLEIMMHIVSFLYAMVELYFIKSNAVVTRSRSSELWL